MRQYLFAAVAALVVMSSSSALATQSYSPFSDPKFSQVLAPVHNVVAALQSGNGQSIKDLYANDAVIIDNVGTLRWNGAAAGTAWLSNVTGQWGKFSDAKITTVQLADIELSNPQKAYVVVYVDHGSFTFTLSKASGSWKITSQTFSPLYGLRPLHP
jgi:hypothetical protein